MFWQDGDQLEEHAALAKQRMCSSAGGAGFETAIVAACLKRRALDEKLRSAGKRVECADLLGDLHRLQHGEMGQNGKRLQVCTEAGAGASAAFEVARLALPPRLHRGQQAPTWSCPQSVL